MCSCCTVKLTIYKGIFKRHDLPPFFVMIESIKWSIAKVIDCSSAHYQILFTHTHLFFLFLFLSFFNCVIRACDDKRYFGPWEGRCEYSLMYAALCDSFTSFTIIQLHNSLAINHMKKSGWNYTNSSTKLLWMKISRRNRKQTLQVAL